MAPYKAIVPSNYGEISELGGRISQTISKRKIPEPEHIAKVLGEEAVPAYYLMHALMHSIEHGRQRGVLDYARRDQKAVQRHSFDAAFKPYFRLYDKNLPSNYLLTPREVKGTLVHDLGEEFGQTLVRALIVNDVIRHLLGEDVGQDADLLTNKNALLSDSLEDKIKALPVIDNNGVYNALKSELSEVGIKSKKSVQWQYGTVLRALTGFKAYVIQNVDYMPNAQKDSLIGILNDLSDGVSKQIKSEEILTSGEIRKHITAQFKHLMELMRIGEYIEFDKRLLSPGDNEFLLSLKKTFYNDFIRQIDEKVEHDAFVSKNAGTIDDSYLSPKIEKTAESTDTVANMLTTPLVHPISIHQKDSILILSNTDLSEKLKNQEIDYQRLLLATDYNYRNLKDMIEHYLVFLHGRAKIDTNWESDKTKFIIMEEGISGLERKIKVLNESPQAVQRRKFLRVASSLLTLGMYKKN